MNTNLLDALQTDLLRLQLHPVNFGVTAADDGHVALHGSLLKYWSLPGTIDGQWLLGILVKLPDAAGPETVMNAIRDAQGGDDKGSDAGQVDLGRNVAAGPAATKEGS